MQNNLLKVEFENEAENEEYVKAMNSISSQNPWPQPYTQEELEQIRNIRAQEEMKERALRPNLGPYAGY